MIVDRFHMMHSLTLIVFTLTCVYHNVNGFLYPSKSNKGKTQIKSKKWETDDMKSSKRRILFQSMSAILMDNANAITNDKPQEFINVGTQAPAPEGSSSFITLSNGIQYKDIKVGVDGGSVTDKSTVQIQCSGRLLNLNGVSYYNTKNNNSDGFGSSLPLEIHLGRGEAIQGLEIGLVGMKKGGIRRIIIPASMGYDMNEPNLEPKPTNNNDQRALDSVLKNPRRDATILMDVSLERFK